MDWVTQSDRLLERKGWWHLWETRLGWDNGPAQSTPRVSHQLSRPGYWRHGHTMVTHLTMAAGRGWVSGWLVTCFLIIPSLASLRSLTRMSQIELRQTKQQLGSRGCAAARARLLMAIIQCFMIRHQPGYWGLRGVHTPRNVSNPEKF